jgi:hypothetical protein
VSVIDQRFPALTGFLIDGGIFQRVAENGKRANLDIIIADRFFYLLRQSWQVRATQSLPEADFIRFKPIGLIWRI